MYSIFIEISEYIQSQNGDEEKIKRLHLQLAQHPDQFSQICEEIVPMISDNKSLSERFDAFVHSFDFSNNPLIAVTTFLVNVSSSVDHNPIIVQNVPRLTSLYIENMIPYEFFQFRFLELCPDLGHLLVKLNTGLSEYRTMMLENVMNKTHGHIPESLFINSSFDATSQMQILVALSQVPNFEKSLCCLRLFSTGLIPSSQAQEWIETICSPISICFQRAIEEFPPSSFLPFSVFSEMKLLLSVEQLKWAFGDNNYQLLSQMPISYPTIIQEKNAHDLEKARKVTQRQKFAIDLVKSLKVNMFYSSLLAIPKAIRQSTSPFYTIPQSAIKSLFGSQILDKNECFFEKFLQIVFRKGSELKASISPIEEAEPRFQVYKDMKPDNALQTLLFSGLHFKRPSNVVFNVVRSYFEIFSSVDASSFFKIFDNEEQILNENQALSLFYFSEFSKMADSIDEASLKSIPKIIFTEGTDRPEFNGKSISNSDIVLKQLAIAVAGKKTRDNFIFQMTKNGDEITLRGAINPFLPE